MRASSLCLVFGLVLLMAWTSEAQVNAPAVPQSCCFSHIDFPIPDSKVVSAVRTPLHCPVPGVLVTTRRTQFCVKPDEAWIQKHLQK